MRVRCWLCWLAIALVSCGKTTVSSKAPTSPPPTPPAAATADLLVSRQGEVITRLVVELAETPEDRARGLMARSSLPQGRGMAFLFDSETVSPFFMKNTLIPLDIAFWDRNLVIVDMKTMMPCEQDPCPLYQSSTPFLGAVEVNADALIKAGIAAGDRVTLKRL